MSWFKRRKMPPLPEASRLGVRSRTVLAKLGFDLRGYYEDLIHDPLPDEFRESLNAVSAQERQTGDLIQSIRWPPEGGVLARDRRTARATARLNCQNNLQPS